jgi:hypothetical protein
MHMHFCHVLGIPMHNAYTHGVRPVAQVSQTRPQQINVADPLVFARFTSIVARTLNVVLKATDQLTLLCMRCGVFGECARVQLHA